MKLILSSFNSTLNWDSNSSPTVEGPGSFSLVSARFRISSISISCDHNRLYSISVFLSTTLLYDQHSPYLWLLFLPLWLFEKLLCTKLEDGREFLLVKRC